MSAKTILAAILGTNAALSALAAEPPSAEEVRKVLHYYHQGDAPLLVDFKLCDQVLREGPDKYDCANEIDPQQVKVGQSVLAWMNFMVPAGDRGQVLLQLNQDGITRATRSAEIKGGMRYRTWRRVSFDRAGDWELPIIYENDHGIYTVDQVRIRVTEPLLSAAPELAAPVVPTPAE